MMMIKSEPYKILFCSISSVLSLLFYQEKNDETFNLIPKIV